MNIGLDYDGTVTLDVRAWSEFVLSMHAQGHRVYLTTMRYSSELSSIHPIFGMLITMGRLTPVCTARKAKAAVCAARGITIHVWIDDKPQAVHQDADVLWPGTVAPEGSPMTINAAEAEANVQPTTS